MSLVAVNYYALSQEIFILQLDGYLLKILVLNSTPLLYVNVYFIVGDTNIKPTLKIFPVVFLKQIAISLFLSSDCHLTARASVINLKTRNVIELG